MAYEVMHEFSAGEGGWDQFEIIWDNKEIIIRDEVGYIRFHERHWDEFFEGIERLREKIESRRFGFLDEDEEADEVEYGVGEEPEIQDEDDMDELEEGEDEENA